MNKNAIKNFAIWARNKLIADISYRAGLMGITADGIHPALPQSTGQTKFYDIGTAEPYAISGEAIHQREHLADLIRRKAKDSNYQTAYKYIIEEVAYTWFNRLIAVRFMEVNDYLPSHIRVLSSDQGKIEPDLVTTPFDADLDFTRDEQQAIIDLKNDNKLDELFRLLFIKQCNALNEILPDLFEKTNDYTELLLNLSVIDQDGVVYHLVHDIPEEDFDIERGGQVEIIGWLYQYYNTEPKNAAFAKKGKITKEEIPAVTQLFTPDWIVRYMVENSLGRLWIEHLLARGDSRTEAEIAADFGWKYYLPEAEQEPEVATQLVKIREERRNLTPEEIRCIDPCMGSGHICVYLFSVLMQIYESAGYGQRDASRSILENNLYGLDIDDRAFQMAYFAVMMKAREYNRRILNGKNRPNLYSIQESNGIDRKHLLSLGRSMTKDEWKAAVRDLNELLDIFMDAKEYGSILTVKKYNWERLEQFLVDSEEEGQISLNSIGVEQERAKLLQMIKQGKCLEGKYDVAITNPPYMGVGNVGGKLYDFVCDQYEAFKQDMYCVLVKRVYHFTKSDGYQAMITQQSFMFNSRFEKMRDWIIPSYTLNNLVYLDTGAFEEISGEKVRTCTFVFSKKKLQKYKSAFVDLRNAETASEKEEMFLAVCHNKPDGIFYSACIDSFKKIDGSCFSYWLSEKTMEILGSKDKVGKYAETRHGLVTGNGELFMRLWHEVAFSRICLDKSSESKWYPYNKGGSFRRWYGNREYIVNWQNNGQLIKSYRDEKGIIKSSNYNEGYNFRQNLSWSDIRSGKIAFRYTPKGALFDTSGPSMVMLRTDKMYDLLGFLNTKVMQKLIDVFCTGLHYATGAVERIPLIDFEETNVSDTVKQCILIAKNDWDSFETSWDFECHPIVKKGLKRSLLKTEAVTIEECYDEWSNECHKRFVQLKANEEELNHTFIGVYGLQGELSEEVDEKDVTVCRANLQRDIKSLLSYAVGCMFGRYSLSSAGLIFAGDVWDDSKYDQFKPDVDNIIPISDEEYLEDDIVSRFCAFLKVAFGDLTLEKNLDYIATALGGKRNSSRETIRNYFVNDFFKDHCQTYSVSGSGKRPIYWLFDSGKQNGFKALIYLHRYNADTIGNLRIDYLHRMQRIYESEIGRMQDMIDYSTNSREIGQATKRKDKLTKQLKECYEYDEKLAHLALSRIELDLDDGVKVNYRKMQTANDGQFYEVLADSKNIMAKK